MLQLVVNDILCATIAGRVINGSLRIAMDSQMAIAIYLLHSDISKDGRVAPFV